MSTAGARFITFVVSTALAGGCVADNDRWDPPDDAAGSTGGQPHRDDTDEPDTDASSDDATTDPAGGPDAAIEACLEMELAACEQDATIVCADVREDAAHCGACFHDCTQYGSDKCRDGVCECPGKWGAVCEGTCMDTRSDPRHCGIGCADCEATLGTGATCKDGECRPPDED